MRSCTSGFAEVEFRNAYPDRIQFHYWNSARNRIVQRLLGRLIDSSDAVLEIGCGTGVVTRYLRGCGIDCRGCDIAVPPIRDAGAADYVYLGRDAFDLPEEVRLPIRLVLLLDVLEHLERPREFLSRCVDRFPSLRCILLTVPARMELWSNYDEYYGHYRRYDRCSLDELVDPARFEFRRWGYLFHALYPAALLLRLLGVPRPVKLHPPRWRPLHRLVAAAFDLEAMLLPSRLPGMSLYAALAVRQ